MAKITDLSTELLESILSYLDMQTLLLSQRVSTKFQATIQGSITLKKALWLVPESTVQPPAQACPFHNTFGCSRTRALCLTIPRPKVMINPLIRRVLANGNRKQLLPMQSVLEGEDILDLSVEKYANCSAVSTFMRTARSQGALAIFLNRPTDSGNLSLRFKTIKKCLEARDTAANQSWEKMILLQAPELQTLTVRYEVVEYSAWPRTFPAIAKPVRPEAGRYERTHSIDAGGFVGAVTVGELIDTLRLRHRDIHMLE